MNTKWTTIRTALVAMAAILLVAAPAWAGTGACLSVESPGAIRLPDGSPHASTQLTLCPERVLSPITVLYQIRAGGYPVGIFQSRVVPAEEEVAEPYVLFLRAADGRLEIVGFVLPGPDGSTAYRMMTTTGRARAGRTPTLAALTSAPMLRVPGRFD